MTLSDPQTLYRKAGKVIPYLMKGALLLFIVGFCIAFFVSPVDARQGYAFRILFIHVPSAWLSLLIYVLMAIASIRGLLSKSRQAFIFAEAMAPTGAVMTIMALASGAFWGRPTWGAYWVWDARITSELILLFLYLGFIALHSAIENTDRADRASSIISIVGVVNVPIIYFSVQWWNTLHQGASISSQGISIAPVMFSGLLVMTLSAMLYATGAMLARTRTIILERERREDWTHNDALEGRL